MAKIIEFKSKEKIELEQIKEEIRRKLSGAFGEAIKRKLEARIPNPEAPKKPKLTICETKAD